jgi:hypothetical protein
MRVLEVGRMNTLEPSQITPHGEIITKGHLGDKAFILSKSIGMGSICHIRGEEMGDRIEYPMVSLLIGIDSNCAIVIVK